MQEDSEQTQPKDHNDELHTIGMPRIHPIPSGADFMKLNEKRDDEKTRPCESDKAYKTILAMERLEKKKQDSS